MKDESVIEWANDWLRDAGLEDPTFKQRFLDGLALELKMRRETLDAAVQVIESFRPLAQAAKAIADDGWPALSTYVRLPASLEARLQTLRGAYEGIADMVADADAECAEKGGIAPDGQMVVDSIAFAPKVP